MKSEHFFFVYLVAVELAAMFDLIPLIFDFANYQQANE